jgi:hypothetical protein
MPQVYGYLRAAAVLRPIERSSPVVDVLDVEASASLDERSDHVEVSGDSRLVQRRRVCVGPWGIVSVRVLAGVEQQRDDRRMPVLGGKRQREMFLRTVSGWEGLANDLHAAGRGRRR